jgi:uroporphyrinogen III methyltransferase/synthase
MPADAPARVRELFAGAQRPHCVTFTSSSTVQNFVAAAGGRSLAEIHVVTIGPVTTKTAKDLGIQVTAQAEVYTIDGLLDAVIRVIHSTGA